MEFTFDNERPIYLQLVEQLEKSIVSGELTPGERLPSVRDFAYQCKVNPNTMQRAMATLEDMGLIFTERTNGKFVTSDEQLVGEHRKKYAESKAFDFFNAMGELGFTKEEAIKYLESMK